MEFLLPLLGGALGGAVIAGTFAVINAHVAHTREQKQWERNQNQEHERWKRERKYDAYMLFFYELSRTFDWTQDVVNTGRTDSQTNREEAEGIWRMSAAINMHLPEELAEDFSVVVTFMTDLSQWGRNTLAGIRDPARYHRLHADNSEAVNKLAGAMRADLKI